MTMSEQIKSFKDLNAWQRAYELTLRVYHVTTHFPSDERYGLVSQMRRAACSIPCNIAEGWGRGSRTDYRRFVLIARGSVYELQTLAWISCDLGYLKADDDLFELLEQTDRLINGLARALDRP